MERVLKIKWVWLSRRGQEYMDFGEKPEKDRESRGRKLFQLIEKHSRRIVPFIDDAHKLTKQDIVRLEDAGRERTVRRLGRAPCLTFNLKRGGMEEIGMRCECLELQGLAGETSSYRRFVDM